MQEVCPINFETVNSRQVQITALLLTAVTALFLVYGSTALLLFILYDYAARVLFSDRVSLLALISRSIIKLLNLEPKPADGGAKAFAARIGFAFAIIAVVAQLSGYASIAVTAIAILCFCTALDGFLNFCIGCKFYSILKYFKLI